jgi:putative membrane protein
MTDLPRLLAGSVMLRPYVFVFLLAYLFAAVSRMGWARTATFTAIAWAVAYAAEFSSTRNGFPFGLYHYIDVTRDRELWISNVPFFDSLSFTFLCYLGHAVAVLLWAPLVVRPNDFQVADTRAIRTSTRVLLTGAFLTMLLDVVIDPVTLQGDRWFLGRIYYYPNGGVHFGVPLSNYVGWFLVALASIGIFRVFERRPGWSTAGIRPLAVRWPDRAAHLPRHRRLQPRHHVLDRRGLHGRGRRHRVRAGGGAVPDARAEPDAARDGGRRSAPSRGLSGLAARRAWPVHRSRGGRRTLGDGDLRKDRRLRVRREVDVPLREVSGICLRRSARRRMALIAVGDRAAKLAWAPLPRGDDGELDWRTVNIARLAGSALPARDPQIEAVCADGKGRVLLLQESPPRAELVDLDASRVVASIELVVEGDDELADSWNDSDGSRGEGAVLLRGGHLLVAKEKHPAVLIEFGPAGARPRGFAAGGALADGARWPIGRGRHRFLALAVWWPDKGAAQALPGLQRSGDRSGWAALRAQRQIQVDRAAR